MATYTQAGYRDPAVRVYAALLRLYPRGHRRVYGAPMVQLFRDQVRDARTTDGRRGLLLLYLRALVDLAGSVLREHGHAIGIGEPIGGWSYTRAAWWQALLAAAPGLLLIATDSRLLRLVLPSAPYPHPTAIALLPAGGCLAIVGFALLRERRLPDWALTSVGLLALSGPYIISRIWREGSGSMWAALGLPLLVLVLVPGSVAGMATVLRKRLWTADLPGWAWIVAGLSLLSLGAAALLEAHYTPYSSPWRWETVLMALKAWGFPTALFTMPLLCAATLAPARGARCVLLVLPIVLWWSVGLVLEPGDGLTTPVALAVVALLPTAVLLVLMPVMLLRVRAAAYQALGLFLACMGTMLLLEMLRASVLPAHEEGARVVHRAGLALQLAISLAFGVALYDRLARSAQMDWVV